MVSTNMEKNREENPRVLAWVFVGGAADVSGRRMRGSQAEKEKTGSFTGAKSNSEACFSFV